MTTAITLAPPVDSELNCQAHSLNEWNEWTYARWESLTDDQRRKASSWTGPKWKFKTMHCSAGPPQYSFDPDAPDYASLTGGEANDDA